MDQIVAEFGAPINECDDLSGGVQRFVFAVARMPLHRPRTRPRSGQVEPCLPRLAREPPTGPGWIHEIKHDGFRIMARRDTDRVRLITRNGYNFAARFPKIVDAIASMSVRSCLIDGEAIVVDKDGLSVFDLIRYRQHDHSAILCAFDLIEVDGKDLRRSPIEDRKSALAEMLRKTRDGIAFNTHHAADGLTVFKARLHARLRRHCVETARLGLSIRPGRSLLKIKNPTAPAVKREAEEEWR